MVHADASKVQLGTVINQDNEIIAFYSRKLNLTQVHYTTIERELMSIAESLKEFKDMK